MEKFDKNLLKMIVCPETGRDLISVANTGPTALIKSNGKIDKLFPTNKELVQSVELTLNNRKTIYMFLGDIPLLLSLFISFIGLLRLRKSYLRDI